VKSIGKLPLNNQTFFSLNEDIALELIQHQDFFKAAVKDCTITASDLQLAVKPGYSVTVNVYHPDLEGVLDEIKEKKKTKKKQPTEEQRSANQA